MKYFLIISLLLITCGSACLRDNLTSSIDKKKTIYIVPLDNVKQTDVALSFQELKGFYNYDIVILNRDVTPSQYRNPSGKYDAGKILKFLGEKYQHLNGKVIVWSQHEKICEVEAHTDACLGVSLSPDGRFITSVGRDDVCSIIDIHMAQSGPIHKLKGFKALSIDAPPSVSMDSKFVSVCASGGIYSWDMFLGTPIGSVATDATCLTWVSSHSVSDCGYSQQLISTHENGTVKWWST